MRMKRRRVLSVCTLVLLAVSTIPASLAPTEADAGVSSGYSLLEDTGDKGVPWADLAPHLTWQGRTLLQLDLCDCPDNLADLRPARVVAQFIENTFYAWEEYEVVVDGDVRLCIVMRKPEPGLLTAGQAQVLLTGSMLWRQSTPAAQDGAVWGEDRGQIKAQAIIGVDDRTRITDTQTSPWNTYCCLYSGFPFDPTWWQGTGCLVGPYMVLTCAHNLYDRDAAAYTSKVIVSPGQRQDYKDGPVAYPYGTRTIVDSRVIPGFTTAHALRADDCGVAFLDRPFVGINTYMPLEFSGGLSLGDTVRIAGYAGEVRSGTYAAEENSLALWDASGPLADQGYSNYLCYAVDTSDGDSGAPVHRGAGLWLDPYRIIGIHSGVNPDLSLNGGPRFNSDNQALLTAWMEWRPNGQGRTVLWEDSLPSTKLDGGKWAVVHDATADTLGLREPSAPYALRLNGYPSGGDSVESRTMDLSPCSSATLTYWSQRRGDGDAPEAGDDLIVEYHNGTGWMELDRQWGSGPGMTAFERRTISLPPAALHAAFRLKIRSIGTADTARVLDDWLVDDVRIEAGPPRPPVTINFDDAVAPSNFNSTVRLTNRYGVLGVTFAGPGANDGGVILSAGSNYGVTGYSRPNCLAFQEDSKLLDKGVPRGPETLVFSPPVSHVALSAATDLAHVGCRLTLDAFGVEGYVLDTKTVALTTVLTPVAVAASGITRVVVASTAQAFVLDDLTFSYEPLPNLSVKPH